MLTRRPKLPPRIQKAAYIAVVGLGVAVMLVLLALTLAPGQ